MHQQNGALRTSDRTKRGIPTDRGFASHPLEAYFSAVERYVLRHAVGHQVDAPPPAGLRRPTGGMPPLSQLFGCAHR
jgi:hypothetical protein